MLRSGISRSQSMTIISCNGALVSFSSVMRSRDLPAFHAIRLNVDDKNFLMSGNAMRRDPEGFAFVFEFPYHDVSSDPVVIATQALKRGDL